LCRAWLLSSQMVVVDPVYYVVQVLLFVWNAVLLGFFLKDLIVEVTSKGWGTPRTAWLICLCFSSTVFAILHLDPRGILGMYPPAAIVILEWSVILSVLNSFAFSAYMYLIAIYQRNMTSVPACLRNYWLVFNVAFFILHIVLSATGAILGNMFWFGVDGFALVVHELSHILVLNVCICKLARYLQHLTQERKTLGATETDFSSALRKMMYVRVGSIFFFLLAFLYEIFAPGNGALDRISAPNTHIMPYDNAVFTWSTNIGIFLVILIQSLLLYILRRPRAKGSERTSERTQKDSTKEISSSSSSRPSVV